MSVKNKVWLPAEDHTKKELEERDMFYYLLVCRVSVYQTTANQKFWWLVIRALLSK